MKMIVGLFMSYLCNLFLISIFVSIMINCMNTGTLVLLLVSEYVLLFLDDNVDEEYE